MSGISLKFIGKSYRIVGEASFVKESNDYLGYCDLRNLSVFTIRSYGYDLVALIRWLETGGIFTREALQGVNLIQFLYYLKEAQLHPNSINHCFFTAIVFYRFLFGVKPKLPFDDTDKKRMWWPTRYRYVTRPSYCKVKVPRRLMEPLKPREVRCFFERCSKYRDLAIVSLMLFCGLRSREVITITLQDIDFTRLIVRVMGKGNRERHAPITENLARILRRYLDLERPENSVTDFLFVVLQGHRRGHGMGYWGLRSLFRSRRKDSSLSRANPHRFRHTFGTDMAKNGVKLTTLQRLMGHSTLEMTTKYINFSMIDVHEEYQRIIHKIHAQYQS